MPGARPQFRVHTLLALMAVACVVLATWRESAAALGFVMVVIAASLAVLTIRRRSFSTGLRLCYGALVGLIVGMLFVTTRETHNHREEIVLLAAAALGGALGGWASVPRAVAEPEGHPLDRPEVNNGGE